MKTLKILIIFTLFASSGFCADLGDYSLDGSVTFSATIHESTSGLATDADAGPSYRIYEATGTTVFATGTMALLDAANTTGLYKATVVLSTTNGFSVNGDYLLYIEAVVKSVTGTISHRFRTGVGTTWGSNLVSYTYTVTSAAPASVPIPDVDVWVTTSTVPYEHLVYSGETNNQGQLTLQMKPGTYYFWSEKGGFNFTNPTTVTIEEE